MESTQPRIKKIKVKKPKRPSFKNRLIRAIKKGYISNTWLWNILIFSILIVLIGGSLLVLWLYPLPKDFNQNKGKSEIEEKIEQLEKRR